MKIGFCLTLSLFACIASGAPKVDPAVELFDPSAVHTIQLTVTPDQWKAVEPKTSRQGGGFMRRMEYPVIHATVEFEGKSCPDVALRYKGNSSFMMARNSLKKSLKLDFNKFVENRTFFGLTTVNLNNNAGDSSGARETLGYELFAAAKVPSARTAMMRVELNVQGVYDHKFLGLYTMVEEVGKRFLKSRFGESKGLLLKPDMARNLPYQGEAWDAYKKLYVPKTDGTPATQKRFIDFLKLVHQGNDAEFDSQIESFLDVDEFLRFLAVNAMTSNLDSILSMGHNFYVYIPEKLGPIQFIPWDLNEAFGGFGMGMTSQMQVQLSLMHPHAGENKLIERVLALPRFKQRYQSIVRDLSADAFSVKVMNVRIDTIAKLTSDLLAQEKKDGLSVGQPGGGPGRIGGGFGGPGGGPNGGGPDGLGGTNRGPSDGGPGGNPDGDGNRRFGGPGPDLGAGPNDRGGDGPPARPDGPPGKGFDGPGPGSGPNGAGVNGRNGSNGRPVPAGGMGPRGKPELKPFIAARNQSIADQLDGKSKGETPPVNRGPGGGGPFGGGPRNGPNGAGGQQPPR
jgi:spore coat protein CotH